MASRILTCATFPVIFCAALGLAAQGLAAGWNRAALVAGINVATASLLLLLERVHPHERRWQRSQGDVRTDVIHVLVSMAAVPELFRAAVFGALYLLSARFGLGVWPTQLPLAVQLPLALLIAELGSYWMHRWMHERPWLWRLHAVHHSAPRLYWLNAGRFHPLDTLLTYPAQVVPLTLLGVPPDVMTLFVVFTGVHGMFQHANVRLRLGPLNWIFSMAELHRWHHSKTVVESNTNYGSNLIFWDIVFRTRFLPADREPPPEIGFEGSEDYPRAYLAQLARPFRETSG